MKYEDFDGPVEELVRMKIKEIEEKENIRVLHVIESGSRAWGFASPDSDYDVRFIYVRDKDFYLSLRDTKDFIDWELNEVLDINGWDLKKALMLMLLQQILLVRLSVNYRNKSTQWIILLIQVMTKYLHILQRLMAN